jgi:hypothetical protein
VDCVVTLPSLLVQLHAIRSFQNQLTLTVNRSFPLVFTQLRLTLSHSFSLRFLSSGPGGRRFKSSLPDQFSPMFMRVPQ